MNIKNKLKMVKMADIKPYEKNAKKHPKWQVDLIAESLKNNDYYSPIGIDANNEIVIGHGRFEAMQQMKSNDDLIEVVDFSYLSPSQIKKLRIMDNKIVSDDYDKVLLEQELKEIIDQSDGDLEKIAQDIGITEDDLKSIIPEEYQETHGDDEVPEEVPNITKLGDLWELGEHRLLCGDSTEEDDINRLMDGNKADMVFTDPPYGMSLDTDYSGMVGWHTGKKHKKVKGDNEDFKPSLINTVFENFNYCKDIFLWGADYYAELLPDKNKGSWIVWDKRLDESADKLFGSTFELCWSRKKRKRFIARIKWAGFLHEAGEIDVKRQHPTQKPISLPVWFFDTFKTPPEVLVVDLFLGSGSTLIACEKTNRKCYGMELDEHYCDVIVQRYHDFCIKNGKTPTIKRNGEIYEISDK